MKPLFLKKLVLGAFVAVAVWGVSAVIFSLISVRLADPKKLLGVFSVITIILGSFIGARTARQTMESRLFSALLATLSAIVPYFIASLIISGRVSPLKILIVFISAFAGAFLERAEKKNTSSKRIRKNVAARYAGR